MVPPITNGNGSIKDISSSVQRPLVIKRNGVETTITIPILQWPQAESLRDTLPDLPTVTEDQEFTEIELTTQILSYALSRVTQDTAFESLPFVTTVFSHFQHQFLRHHNIHRVVRDMPTAAQSYVLKTYYAVLTALRKQGLVSREEFLPAPSALMSAVDAGKARLFAVFGGQGNVDEYFDELVSINASYEALIKPFLVQSGLTLAQHSTSTEAQRIYCPKIDILDWLEKPHTRPSTDALLAASVSLPVIGLVQLLNYWVTMKVLDKTPSDFRTYMQGATGHSQGIISAVVISASDTDKEFVENTQKALGLLFWIGARCQAACPTTTVNPNILEDSIESSEGVPTPMLSIVGLRLIEVQKQVDATNVHLPEHKKICLSLINGPRAIICTGTPQSLYGLNVALRKLKADLTVDQTRVPHSQRRIRFSSRFLPVMVPFHSQSLSGVASLLDEDVKSRGLSFDNAKLGIPVYNTNTGDDLRSSKSLTRELCDMICTLPVKWELATKFDRITHLIDFGPGGASGIGGLTHKNKEGTGVQVVLAGTLDAQKEELLDKSTIFEFDSSAVTYAPNWAELYRPRLLRIKRTGEIHVDTPFSRLLGKPHLMVAGMTPATVSPDFCSAVINAGYHVEWAGGGQYNEYILRVRTQQIMDKIQPGEGIALNMLFLNAYQWGFQYPAVVAMRKEGIPLDAITIGAGVPSLDVANEFIANFRNAGVRHVGFKPGSAEMIRRVIQIAKSNPNFPIVLQWTGGRAGGHHSFEDFHGPILETYGSIRRQPNILLVGGSGFGGADDTLPYLTGTWSEKFDLPPMPFDGILFGSRVMVAKEGQANRAVKELIVQAAGVENESEWEKTYRGAVGGVITVQSELGEPIHKIATRGVLFWKELDEQVFALPRGEKRSEAVAKRKDWIIHKLNADYQKPYFGRKSDGHVAELHEMTYKEVAERMVELMYIRLQNRWLDVSLRNLTGDFLRRVEERFSHHEALSMIQTNNELNEPDTFLAGFFEAFPSASEQTLTNEDVLHFLAICGKRVWQKPVPFVPIVDGNLEFWFKKDSLWQSEDLDAVIGRDAQRVPILQGPVAVKYSKIVNEPVKSILGNIYSSHIKSIKDMYYDGKDDSIPTVEYLGARGGVNRKRHGVSQSELPGEEGSSVMYETARLSGDLPADFDYLDALAQPDNTWLRAFLTSPSIVRGHLLVPNPVQRILRPRPRQTVFVQLDKSKSPQLVTVYDQAQTGIPSRHPAVVISHEGDDITLTLYEKRDSDFVPLQFVFQYRPGLYPIHEVMEGRNQRIKSFYGKLWYVDEKAFNLSTRETFRAKFSVDRQRISDFTNIIGNTAEMYVSNGNVKAPMDFAIVAGWQALVTAILPKEIDGDLLRLVHLSNEFRMLDQSGMLEAGDAITVEAVVDAVIISEMGKTVAVKATLFKHGHGLMEILSRFLYRGKFNDYENTFRRTVENPMQVDLKTKKDIAVLQDKKWVNWHKSEAELSVGSTLIFRLRTLTKFKDDKLFSKVSTNGAIFLKTSRETVEIGTVAHEDADCVGNVVLEYLNRNGTPIEQAIYFKTGGYSILPDPKVFPAVVTVPSNNHTYAQASGDWNPIHVNPYFADLADLPGTITHGMWTSASTRKFVEIFAANNHPDRVKEYNVTFVDMVLPGDQLETKLYHVGMINGRKLVKIETYKLETGAKVLEGTAEVDQPITSYVFTGQGSQEPAMGMDLYASSEVAKSIWDRADHHMISTYGVSILDIVKNNPKSKTIYFGGLKGSRIREQYTSMMYDVLGADGKIVSRPLFPDITAASSSFSFTHPAGLLSATQFTQPALVLMEIASFQDMKANGLVQEKCPFAGHSLGEYAALASVGEVLTVESLVDVVFYRGMTMQVAVPRHSDGRSDYGMVAINPLRVGPTMGEAALKFVISAVSRRSGLLLEIVNFNVENFQYVVAGEVTCLDTLRLVLNKIKTMNLNFIELIKTRSVNDIEGMLDEILDGCLSESRKRKEASGGVVNQERGIATIPLAGIDVPFHSSFLLNGVVPFREILRKKLEPRFINVSLLIQKYIPNLTARPFELSREYIQNVYDQTHSVTLKNILEDWTDSRLENATEKQQLGYVLLIELLAHQFASPVLWIQTQDRLFKEHEVERLVEVGPTPVLCSMAQRTLKTKYEAYDDAVTRRRVTLCTSKDSKDIYYDYEDEPEASSALNSDSVASAPLAASAPVAPVAAVPIPTLARTAGDIPDANVTAQEIIHVIVCHKLKKTLAEVPMSKAIKDLVGGKSTLQNEILGDLGAEFGSVPADKAEEVPLGELATLVQMQHSGNLGKTTNTLINKMISGKMPGGFGMGQVKAYLSSTHGLGPKRIEGVLLHGLASEPAARLMSESESKSWLDTQAVSYASKMGINLGGAAVSGGAHGRIAAGPVVNSEDFELLKAKTQLLIRQQLEQFAKYLDIDLLEGAGLATLERDSKVSLQNDLDKFDAELGEEFSEGIKPVFSQLKARRFDSSWNWARQDALRLYYDIIFGRITGVDRELMQQVIHIMNRTEDAGVIAFIEYFVKKVDPSVGEGYKAVKEYGKILIENCRNALNADPVYKNITYRPTRPRTYATEDGKLVYQEERRAASNMKDYVKEIQAGSSLTKLPPSQSVIRKFEELQSFISSTDHYDVRSKAKLDLLFADIKNHLPNGYGAKSENLPFVFLNERSKEDPTVWVPSAQLTSLYLDGLSQMAADGLTFKGKQVLITGCGKDSIGSEVLKALLSGGARVIATTSRFSKIATEYFRSIYERYGSKGSKLIVVPFNGGSVQDVKALVEYIYSTDEKTGLAWDLDFVIPFGAISVVGREIDQIDSRTELAHRILLTNVLRLLGEIKTKKQAFGYDTRPAAVMLPLSPNHGTFGADGMYGEAKIALETLLNRFHSEHWGAYLTMIGAVIGWTRGTGLMGGNNIVAEGIESLGARTFSQHEMAFNLVGLLHPNVVKLAETEPVLADLNGGLHFVADLNKISSSLRTELTETAEVRRAIAHEKQLDVRVLNGPKKQESVMVTPKANFTFRFPEMPKSQTLTHLRGMLDLEKVVVVTGFGEVGPYGGSRTRWEMEAFGEFSLEGCVEMAWLMGYIKFHDGPLKKIPWYTGWIELKTELPIKDHEVKARFEQQILEHTGIRLIEPALFDGYDPQKKMFLQEVAVTADLAPVECSREEADAFKHHHGENCVIEQRSDQYFVRIKKGATLYVPKALRFDRFVAGQIPTGWDALRYGVPQDIVKQVDPITIYVLVSTVEALVTSGVTDPYEFYQYVHVSEVGNTAGGGMGGMRALRLMFKDRLLEKPVQSDILQETFINTMPAWINMLLMSSSGPIKTPVGACATAAESVEVAVETILSGKARIVLCGGYDDFHEEGSYEFANMKATSSATQEMAYGREPKDMCRPATDTRGGFMESQGAGIHVLMSADLAIKMGVPIRGIIALTNTATDKNGRSVPAPGKGILTTAKEFPIRNSSPMFNLDYRKKLLQREREHIRAWVAKEYEALADEVEAMRAADENVEDFIKDRTRFIDREGARSEKIALQSWSHDWWKNDATIAPIRGALATFGLTIDDLGVASFHGTGTKANDYNESSVLNAQLGHLGRARGNACPGIFQKYLTGHPKGAAAAWMLNGVLQVLETGIIPGNRNADNIDQQLRKFNYVFYPSRSIKTDGVKAGLLKSFGFGQAGGEILVIHPDYLFAAVEQNDYQSYMLRRAHREMASYQYFHEMLTGAGPFVRVKSKAPYTDEELESVYLNPLARAGFDKQAKTWTHKAGSVANPAIDVEVSRAMIEAAAVTSGGKGIGVDVQLIAEINVANKTFLTRNFTANECKYCDHQPDPKASYAGKWAAKEAVIKAVTSAAGTQVFNQGSGAPLVDIEIVRNSNQAPTVELHGEAKTVIQRAGVKEVRVTISHSGSYAVAAAFAN